MAFGFTLSDSSTTITKVSVTLNLTGGYNSLSPSYNGSGQLTGTWAAYGRNLDPAAAGSAFDTAPREALLSAFNGLKPNGSWTLFLADRSGGEISTLTGYSVSVTSVPEPAPMLAITAGLLLAAALGLRGSRRASA